MTLNLMKIVPEYLKNHPEQRFTARDIASWILKTHPDECREKQKRSDRINDDAGLIKQVTAEIGAHRLRWEDNYPEIKTTEGRPREYYFVVQTDGTEIGNSRSGKATSTLAEHELYPILRDFLFSERRIRSMRIDEKKGRNQIRGGNKWLYPDLVGMENLSERWNEQIKQCTGAYPVTRSKLWSFEVKKEINRSNVREAFFQAVSNSSWANLGYLVVGNSIDEVKKELDMLANLHGIGCIQLDIENPSESDIRIPAKERDRIDWDVANRLAEENKDFLKYVSLIRQFCQTGDVQGSAWKNTWNQS